MELHTPGQVCIITSTVRHATPRTGWQSTWQSSTQRMSGTQIAFSIPILQFSKSGQSRFEWHQTHIFMNSKNEHYNPAVHKLSFQRSQTWLLKNWIHLLFFRISFPYLQTNIPWHKLNIHIVWVKIFNNLLIIVSFDFQLNTFDQEKLIIVCLYIVPLN